MVRKIDPDSIVSCLHFLLSHHSGLVPEFIQLQDLLHKALVAAAWNFLYWLNDKISYELARLKTGSKIEIVVVKPVSHRWKFDGVARGWPFHDLIDWTPLDWPLLMKFANDKKFEFSHFGAFFLQPSFLVESKIKHQLQHLLFLDNNQFESDIKRAPESSKLKESSSFWYPCINGGLDGQ